MNTRIRLFQRLHCASVVALTLTITAAAASAQGYLCAEGGGNEQNGN